MIADTSSQQYTFNMFYPGEENKDAYAAIRDLATDPAGKNVFILGSPSTGKTTLLKALEYEFRNKANACVEHFSSEGFKNTLIAFMQQGRMAEFRKRFVNDLDILILDDAQFLSDSIVDVVVRISEAYRKTGKTLILSGDYILDSVRLIPNLQIVQLVRPGQSTRKMILEEKFKAKGLSVDPLLINLIAEEIEDPRRMEGFVLWLYARQKALEEDRDILTASESKASLVKREIIKLHEQRGSLEGRKPSYIIARALVQLGLAQSKAKAGGGWTCGNHTKSVREWVQMQLEKDYAETMLNDLVAFCLSDEPNLACELMLEELSERIPPIFVNGVLLRYLKETTSD